MKPKRRRIILSTNMDVVKKNGVVQHIPTIDALLDTALGVLQNEIHVFKHKTDTGIPLDKDEAGTLTKYVDALVKLSRENREQAKSEELAQLSDQELAELANSIIDTKKLA